MIALNELVKNYDKYVDKYKLMGKKAKLDSIISLEQKFTKLQQETNAKRSNCNKLCSEVANKINSKATVLPALQSHHLEIAESNETIF